MKGNKMKKAYIKMIAIVTKKDIFVSKNFPGNSGSDGMSPDILLTDQPCYLTSPDMYKIIRKHVKDNINTNMATITSDYDFCFTVKKRIKLAKKHKYKVDISRIGSKRSKYETRYTTINEKEIFEMTHKAEKDGGYNEYSPIQSFHGDNQKDLRKKWILF